MIFEASLMWMLVRFSFTHKAVWLVFVSIYSSWSGQSDKVSFFWPIRSQIVKSREFFRGLHSVSCQSDQMSRFWPIRLQIARQTRIFPRFTLGAKHWFAPQLILPPNSPILSHLSHWYLSAQVTVVFAKMLSSTCSNSSSLAHSRG